jgi:hypothetical protein
VAECNEAHMILLEQLGAEHEATVQVQKLLAELCQGEPWIQVRAEGGKMLGREVGILFQSRCSGCSG